MNQTQTTLPCPTCKLSSDPIMDVRGTIGTGATPVNLYVCQQGHIGLQFVCSNPSNYWFVKPDKENLRTLMRSFDRLSCFLYQRRMEYIATNWPIVELQLKQLDN